MRAGGPVAVIGCILAGCSALLDDSFSSGEQPATTPDETEAREENERAERGENDSDSGTPDDGHVSGECTTTRSVGPRRATAATSVSLSGHYAWSSPSNALAADGKSARVELTGGDRSQELLVTGFGFTFPPAAKRLTGIVVSVVRWSEDGQFKDQSIRLYWGGFPRASAKPKTARWSEVAETVTYGAESDRWSDELDLEQAAAADFGVAFAATSSGVDEGRIEDVYMTAHYCE